MTTLYDILIGLPLSDAIEKLLMLPNREILAKNLQQIRTVFSLLENSAQN